MVDTLLHAFVVFITFMHLADLLIKANSLVFKLVKLLSYFYINLSFNLVRFSLHIFLYLISALFQNVLNSSSFS